MKKFTPFSLLFLLLLPGSSARSQDCSKYLFLQQGKTIEVTNYNKKGEPSGRNVYTVSNVSSSGGTTTGTLSSQMFDKKERPTNTSTSTVKCTGGLIQMDMKFMLPDGPAGKMSSAQVSGTGGILEYPPAMKAGDTLKSGYIVLSNSSNSGPGTRRPSRPSATPKSIRRWVNAYDVDLQPASDRPGIGDDECRYLELRQDRVQKQGQLQIRSFSRYYEYRRHRVVRAGRRDHQDANGPRLDRHHVD